MQHTTDTYAKKHRATAEWGQGKAMRRNDGEQTYHDAVRNTSFRLTESRTTSTQGVLTPTNNMPTTRREASSTRPSFRFEVRPTRGVKCPVPNPTQLLSPLPSGGCSFQPSLGDSSPVVAGQQPSRRTNVLGRQDCCRGVFPHGTSIADAATLMARCI